MKTSFRLKRLTYNYHRLIDASQSKDGELPASEMCALEEGEEEDEEVSWIKCFPLSRFFWKSTCTLVQIVDMFWLHRKRYIFNLEPTLEVLAISHKTRGACALMIVNI